jgi:hypothetical protein
MSRIIVDAEGFELLSDGGETIAKVVWMDLDRIDAYNSDLICLDFFSGDQSATITEDDLGFEDLVPQLIANLDLEDPEWFQTVLRPGGERILVFDREAGY